MEILEIHDKNDGSATVTLDLTTEEYMSLVEIGFNKILKDSLDNFEKELNE